MAKKLIRTRDDVDALKAGDKPYAVATSIRNVRVHVAPSGRKTFQMRRNGTMVTLGPVADLSFKDLQRIAVTGETPAEVEQRTRRIEHWIASYEAATSDLVSCKVRAGSLRRFLEPILRHELTAITVNWMNNRCQELLKHGLKGRTVRTYRTNVCMLINYAIDEQGIKGSPLGRRRLMRVPVDEQVQILSLGDLHRLERQCYQDPDIKVACVIMIAKHTAMRRGEVMNLTWADLNLEGQASFYVAAGTSKTRRGRTVGVNGTLKEFLLERKDRLAASGKPFDCGKSFDDRFKRFRARAKLSRHHTAHHLRHSAVSDLLDRGVPPNQVLAISGHSGLASLKPYVHARHDQALRATAVLAMPPDEGFLEKAGKRREG